MLVEAAELDRSVGPALDAGDVHHLARVLRLRLGEPVTVTDGQGRWRACVWRGSEIAPEPVGEVASEHRLTPLVTVGFAPVKGDRPEWVVQKLTEVGVDRIVVLRAARSVIKWEGQRAEVALTRLRAVSREALMQSRQVFLPVVEGIWRPSDVAGAALAHFDGEPVGLGRPTILIGPEGGWSDGELEAGPTVSLGPNVLRAETAAVAAGVLLGALRTRSVVEGDHGPW
ncbi:MAG: 16S rRNA (uracil(1498)-N(3))-methyltransferase [Acidimicrobiales bacterium]